MKRSILLLAVLLMGGCDPVTTADGPRAGGEDFPNTLQALGRTLALGLDSSQAWNNLDSAEVSVANDAALTDTAKLFAGRSLVANCTDTASAGLFGLNRYILTKTKCLAQPNEYVVDTTIAGLVANATGGTDTALYALAVDSVLGRYRVLTTVSDADGNGYFLVQNDPGRVNLLVRKTAGRWTYLGRMLMDPGPDGRYDPGEDNRVYSGSRTLLRLADTVVHETFDPYLVGGPILAAKTDSNLVWVNQLHKRASHTRTVRGVVMAFRDTLSNYPAYWMAHTAWSGGGVRDEMVFGRRADSLFRGGDTVTFLDRSKVGTDSLRVQARAILSTHASDRSGDLLLSIRAERLRTGLFERHSVWEFVSDRPLANGAQPQAGKLEARVEFADGGWIQFSGRWSEGAFSGTYITPTDTATIVVDRHGVVQSVTR